MGWILTILLGIAGAYAGSWLGPMIGIAGGMLGLPRFDRLRRSSSCSSTKPCAKKASIPSRGIRRPARAGVFVPAGCDKRITSLPSPARAQAQVCMQVPH